MNEVPEDGDLRAAIVRRSGSVHAFCRRNKNRSNRVVVYIVLAGMYPGNVARQTRRILAVLGLAKSWKEWLAEAIKDVAWRTLRGDGPAVPPLRRAFPRPGGAALRIFVLADQEAVTDVQNLRICWPCLSTNTRPTRGRWKVRSTPDIIARPGKAACFTRGGRYVCLGCERRCIQVDSKGFQLTFTVTARGGRGWQIAFANLPSVSAEDLLRVKTLLTVEEVATAST